MIGIQINGHFETNTHLESVGIEVGCPLGTPVG